MGKVLRVSVAVLLVWIALVASCGSGVSAAASAPSQMAEAESACGQAFSAVLEAEQAGANVTGLLLRLNNAAGMLVEAEMAYRNKDYDGASEKAATCVVMANGVFADASKLKVSALEDAKVRFSNTLMFSITSAVVFVAGLILVWIWFKRSYLRRLLKMKPEVCSAYEA